MSVHEHIVSMAEDIDGLTEKARSLSHHQGVGDDDISEMVHNKKEEILNLIQNHKYRLERKSESLRDERTSVKRELEEERRRLVEANIQTEDNRKKKEAVLRSIEENQAELEATKAKMNQLMENIPRLSQLKSLHHSVSRLTFDRAAKPNEVKGFVMNPRKNDVSTFSFNYNDPNISSQFVRNHMWDVIAAGVNPLWDNV